MTIWQNTKREKYLLGKPIGTFTKVFCREESPYDKYVFYRVYEKQRGRIPMTYEQFCEYHHLNPLPAWEDAKYAAEVKVVKITDVKTGLTIWESPEEVACGH